MEEYYVVLRHDTSEGEQEKIKVKYNLKLVRQGIKSDLYKSTIGENEVETLSFTHTVIKPKYNVGDEFNYMGKRLVITKIDFHEVNGEWQVVFFYGKKQNEYAYEKQLE